MNPQSSHTLPEAGPLAPDQITVAVTVYDRRRYIAQAIESALHQTRPVRVIVVEDCGPDASLQPWVLDRFGSRIQYFRNPQRRGLFGNLNACIEHCVTPWLSILPDDDFLAPEFVEAMMELSQRAPGCGLYFGETMVVDSQGGILRPMEEPMPEAWRRVEPRLFVDRNLIGFPGHLFRVDDARVLGGFRATSLFCGDWELWARLTARSGAAQAGRPTGYLRQHGDWERGTNRVARSGKQYGLVLVQQKRALALLRDAGRVERFDRRKHLQRHPLPTKYLVECARFFPPRLLAYNCRLLAASTAPHFRYAAFQWFSRCFGAPWVRALSRLWALRAGRGRPAGPQSSGVP